MPNCQSAPSRSSMYVASLYGRCRDSPSSAIKWSDAKNLIKPCENTKVAQTPLDVGWAESQHEAVKQLSGTLETASQEAFHDTSVLNDAICETLSVHGSVFNLLFDAS